MVGLAACGRMQGVSAGEICYCGGKAEVCAGSIFSCLWSACDVSVRSREVQWYPWKERSPLFCWGATGHIGGEDGRTESHSTDLASPDLETAVRKKEQTGLRVDGRTQWGLGTAATHRVTGLCLNECQCLRSLLHGHSCPFWSCLIY